MKILLIQSSYRKNGNTSRICALLEERLRRQFRLQSTPVEFETVQLAQSGLQNCRGCRVCFNKDETFCPFWDDIEPIKTAMQAADVLVLASPVYVEDINGVMKTWIDRLAHISHRPEFGGKQAYLITTSGTGTSGHGLRTMESALRTWGFHIIGKTNFITRALMEADEISSRFLPRIEKIARLILRSAKNNKPFTPSLLSLIYFRVQQVCWQKVSGEDSVDLDYWNSKGWTEPGVTFYVPHSAGWLKVAIARVLGSVIALFFA